MDRSTSEKKEEEEEEEKEDEEENQQDIFYFFLVGIIWTNLYLRLLNQPSNVYSNVYIQV